MKYFQSHPTLLLTGLALGLFLPFLGSVHLFDWDELNFAEAAREMVMTGNYFTVQINYAPFWEKPPLFMWLQAGFMHLLGVNEWAARLPNAICGAITLLLLYRIGQRIYDHHFGLYWALVYAGTLLPHFYFKSGIIDPIFNLFMFLSIYRLYRAYEPAPGSNRRHILLAGVFSGLAVLTKGPVGFLLIGLVWATFAVVYYRPFRLPWKETLAFIGLTVVVSSCWYGVDLLRNGWGFLEAFMVYQLRLLTTQDAGHGGPFYYHFIVLLVGCFPASFFALRSFGKLPDEHAPRHRFRLWMVTTLAVVLIVFSIVKTKILHYSSLAYFPVTFLAVHVLYHWAKGRIPRPAALLTALTLTGLLLAVAVMLAPLAVMYKDAWAPLLNDPFAQANLEASVSWHYYDILPGLAYLLAMGIGMRYLLRRHVLRGMAWLFGSTAFFVFVVTAAFAPRIERYTQGAAIDFYKSKQGREVYVETLGFKSYGHLFYTRKPPQEPVPLDTLLHGRLDKPAWFVSRNVHAKDFADKYSQLEKVYEQHGFVFWKRKTTTH